MTLAIICGLVGIAAGIAAFTITSAWFEYLDERRANPTWRERR